MQQLLASCTTQQTDGLLFDYMDCGTEVYWSADFLGHRVHGAQKPEYPARHYVRRNCRAFVSKALCSHFVRST